MALISRAPGAGNSALYGHPHGGELPGTLLTPHGVLQLSVTHSQNFWVWPSKLVRQMSREQLHEAPSPRFLSRQALPFWHPSVVVLTTVERQPAMFVHPVLLMLWMQLVQASLPSK